MHQGRKRRLELITARDVRTVAASVRKAGRKHAYFGVTNLRTVDACHAPP